MKLSKDYVEGKVQIIAHRGGVVTPESPECSLAAIRKAVELGYDAVELDVRTSADHVDVLREICYSGTDEHVASLEDSFALCASSGIGVMMEFKASGESKSFYQNIKNLLGKYQLQDSTIMFPPKEEVVSFFEGYAPIQQHIGKIRKMHREGLPVNELCFIFEQPWDITGEQIAEMRNLRVFVIIAINTFQYVRKYRSRKPKHYIKHLEADIDRMIDWKVDALQIDSDYHSNFLFSKRKFDQRKLSGFFSLGL
jgi:hypothetical protein